MSEVRRILRPGVRFVIVDRLPLDELGREAATAVYWLLASMVARPVAAKPRRPARLRCARHWPAGPAGLRGKARPDQHRPQIPHRQFLQHDPARMRRAAMPARRQIGRLQPGGELPHLAQRSPHPPSGGAAAALPAVLVRPPARVSRRRDAGLRRAGLYRRRGTARPLQRPPDPRRLCLGGRAVGHEGAAALAALLGIIRRRQPIRRLSTSNPVSCNSSTTGCSVMPGPSSRTTPSPDRRRHLVRLWLRDRGRRAYTG